MYNWVRSLVRTLASVFVTATGFAVLGTDLSGAQVGVVLAFAVGVSQGKSQGDIWLANLMCRTLWSSRDVQVRMSL